MTECLHKRLIVTRYKIHQMQHCITFKAFKKQLKSSTVAIIECLKNASLWFDNKKFICLLF